VDGGIEQVGYLSTCRFAKIMKKYIALDVSVLLGMGLLDASVKVILLITDSCALAGSVRVFIITLFALT